MNIFNVGLLTVVRRPVLQLAAQNGKKGVLLLKMPCKVVACRTLALSPWLNKDTSPHATEKLDLDGWKHVMRSPLQEEESERTLETEEDSQLAATRDLVEMWRLSGKIVPENIKEEELKILMECPSKSSKKKYLKFLALKEIAKKTDKEKNERKKKAKNEQKLKEKEDPDDDLENQHGKLKNTFLMKFWSRSEDGVYNWRGAQSMIFGQPLVYDMAYENYMSLREMQNAVKQLMECEGLNRRAMEPFHLHYCNLNADDPYHKEFIKRYGEAWDKLFVTVTEKDHVEIFPRDQLVYLTADSPNVMKMFEHDKIYIVGSLVDKSIQTGLSLARAKRLNLATARLPLDRYLQWEEGAKNLTLDQMMRILLTLKDTGSWKEALQFVPKRKHAGFVETSYSKHPFDTRMMKTKIRDVMASQENTGKPFARNPPRQQMQKWWEEIS
ncbi:tRNA methyltransferase 10 homolog C [Hemicordylus capensis]|uniref:tRNA methyltransferase 10 homolog C n=1 Tax=Hemicordylus capensis TaxID=884348 RepID=UPI002302604F|nr:tRNA methyltransferase 10 homolog C [Hemicordylus capensis]XP_053162221.1 tRNA methyltransferase 10 homolog C [Hemicordylus capensis]XP_053162222.1 tRNA methyltransferase 10 homolog C [Hemicordylus capensis]